jgi:hypothetical protein
MILMILSMMRSDLLVGMLAMKLELGLSSITLFLVPLYVAVIFAILFIKDSVQQLVHHDILILDLLVVSSSSLPHYCPYSTGL